MSHVEYLSREPAKLMPVEVRCFGDQSISDGDLTANGFGLDNSAYTCPPPLKSVFGAVQRTLDFNTTKIDADVVHCHTWYAHWGGILAKLNYGILLVITVHSSNRYGPGNASNWAAGMILPAGWSEWPWKWRTR